MTFSGRSLLFMGLFLGERNDYFSPLVEGKMNAICIQHHEYCFVVVKFLVRHQLDFSMFIDISKLCLQHYGLTINGESNQ